MSRIAIAMAFGCVGMADPCRAEMKGFGVDLGVGPAFASGEGRSSTAPALFLRTEYGSANWSAGLRGLLAIGGEGTSKGGGSQRDNSGFQAWALLAEGSMHSDGPVALGFRAGAGLGQVVSLNCNCEEVAELRGAVAPVLFAAAFIRGRVGQHNRLSLEASVLRFHELANGPAPFSQPDTGNAAWTALVTLAYGWSQL